ncbi:MAG: hypothetical protein AVDCRST_MAG35-751 [uncultured Quadrisphaera sp.]|uniref:Uncharacterized protein n=1 Tax=uncultured Quadrisphaera sp. TaxID=904978 RepID=A0A6J4NZE3_9ACTN|nr:MAG: hypothetical protein AVDCRST_MAG35-751 [uncultured Quadrisphaera sp.]
MPAAGVSARLASVRCVPGWSWTFADDRGEPLEPQGEGVPQQAARGFPVQADAETWLGESWRRLLAAGAERAELHHEGARVYGPITLRPPA